MAMNRVVAAILATAVLLAGCASSADPSQATLRKERIESWEKLCDGRGFTRGTSDFRDCVMGYDKAAYDSPIK
jgi:hypothetical protein